MDKSQPLTLNLLRIMANHQQHPVQVSLIETPSLTALPESLLNLASSTGAAPELVRAVAASVSGNTLRSSLRTDKAATVVFLCAELEFCARTYSGCVNTSDDTFREMVGFVLDRFGSYNAGEIREAFRLAAARELDVDMKAYHGIFTVDTLGAVLGAYRDYRGRLVTAVLTAEREAEAKAYADRRAEEFDSAGWSTRRLDHLKTVAPFGVEDCTAYDYEHFSGNGKLQVTQEQKEQAWKDAFQAVWSQCATQAMHDYSIRRVLERVQSGQGDESFKNKRTVYAKRLLVYRWIQTIRAN